MASTSAADNNLQSDAAVASNGAQPEPERRQRRAANRFCDVSAPHAVSKMLIWPQHPNPAAVAFPVQHTLKYHHLDCRRYCLMMLKFLSTMSTPNNKGYLLDC